MATLQVGDVIFHFAATRTENYSVEAVMDPSNTHFECYRINLSIVAVVNSVTVASNRPVRGAVGTDNPAGDSLPRSMRELSEYLMKARRRVTYSVGGRVVLDEPRFGDTDVKGGPKPTHARYSQIIGDKTGILQYGVIVHVSRSPNFILSHAWDVSSSIDGHGLTTRTIRGRVAFRKDFLDATLVGAGGRTVMPDDFRRVVFPPCPEGMRRRNVYVEEPRTGDELEYVVHDREVIYGVGENNGGAIEVQGAITASREYPVKSVNQLISKAGSVGWAALSADVMKFGGEVMGLVASFIPVSRASGTVRVTGRKGATRSRLARICEAVILDRLSPLNRPFGKEPFQMVVHVTHNVDSDQNPFAEVKIEVLCLNPNQNPFSAFNLDDKIEDGGAFPMSPSRLTPTLPNANNTRGTWARAMVTQSLAAPDDTAVPDGHPADAAAENRIRLE